MILQYLSDNQGHTTAVQLQISIEDWNRLKEKYVEFREEESASIDNVPQWQVDFGTAELARVKDGSAELRDWQEVKNSFVV